MELFFRTMGTGEPVIILHGLYGSGDNWYSIGRKLAVSYQVYVIDQRNHGNSPHHPEHNYDALANDLADFMLQHQLNNAHIIGHSMGGRTALAFGLKHPEKVKKMIIVDISPVSHNKFRESAEVKYHKQIIDALQKLNLEEIHNRDDADEQLKPMISSGTIRQFLLKNLKSTGNGKFRWVLNINALAENMGVIFEGIIHEDRDPGTIPNFPLLFIKGEKSNYLNPHDETSIRYYFPWARYVVIPDSGHWVHAEQPAKLLEAVRDFIDPE